MQCFSLWCLTSDSVRFFYLKQYKNIPGSKASQSGNSIVKIKSQFIFSWVLLAMQTSDFKTNLPFTI